MKDETIRPGDLVMVVKPQYCCGYSGGLGMIFTASSVPPTYSHIRCMTCGNRMPMTQDHIGLNGKWVTLKSRLKKIHPPALPETVNAGQEVEA